MLTNAEKCKLYYYRHRAERIAHQKAYYLANKKERLEYAHEYGVKEKRRHQSLEGYYRHFDSRRERFNQSRREIVAAAKSIFGNRCGSCGYSESIKILKFHLLVPPKKSGRTRLYEDRNVSALKYPKKFEILCPNCHSIKTKLLSRVVPPTKSALKQRRFREKLLEKFGNACMKCDYRKNLLALQFDHIIPVRGNRPRGSNTQEVRHYPERFQLLCANCHEEKTLSETPSRRPSIVKKELVEVT